MSTKVLVFESDAKFASELKGRLSRFGCLTSVVDDANQGLQVAASDKPDLILLSIELPRMNGFSVCNKLKRDPALKEVPLIIMSSDSTEETFEQHRRLRTRAEDYVHKPIAFDDLVGRIQKYVPLKEDKSAPPSAEEDAIVIDDEIEIEDAQPAAPPADRASVSGEDAARGTAVDTEVDNFTEHAFGALIETSGAGAQRAKGKVEPPPKGKTKQPLKPSAEQKPKAEPEAKAPEARAAEPAAAKPAPEAKPANDGGAPAAELAAAAAVSAKVSEEPPPKPRPRLSSIPPRPENGAESVRLREDLEKYRARVSELEGDLREARSQVGELDDLSRRATARDEEVRRLHREVDEAKAKLASGKTGSSAREFLDLREALNKKDKEILDLRDQVTHRDKELLALRDGALVLEREKADLSDSLEELHLKISESQRKADALAADKEQASKRAEDFRRKSDKLQGELEAKQREIVELKDKHESDMAVRDAREASLRAEHQEVLEAVAEDKRAGLLAAEEQGRKNLERELEQAAEAARLQKEQALAEAQEVADKARAEAVSSREVTLKREFDHKMAALHRANEDSMSKLRAEHALATREAEQKAAETLSAREAELFEQHEAAAREAKERHDTAFQKLQNEKDEGEATRDAQIASLRADVVDTNDQLNDARQTLTARNTRISELESQLNETTVQRDEARKTIEQRDERISSLESDLASTKKGLEETQAALEAERGRLVKARAKWEADSASLERARQALAAALAQIQEAEGRPID